jgi:hypothetical protein
VNICFASLFFPIASKTRPMFSLDAATGVVLAGNFDVDLESLLVVLQRSLVLTLPVVNVPDVRVGRCHVRCVCGVRARSSVC